MASLSFEIELELAGHVTPYRAATWVDPAEGGEVEDLAIADAGLVSAVKIVDRKHPGDRWRTTSFLTGVDTANPEVQKLLANLLNLVWEDAVQAVSDAAEPEDTLADRLWEERREAWG